MLPLDVQDLVYEDRGNRIIRGVNLQIASTGCTAIMGYNGAGKSVLVRLLHGLLTPSSGTLKWSGEFTKDEIARRQSMVFQTPVLLRRSVEANIEYALQARGFNREQCSLRLEEVLREGDLSKLRKRSARVLSAGERQRIAVCRALAVEPEIVFLDEPTASLDPAAILAIEKLLQRAMHAGRKLIIVSQSIGQVKRLARDVIFVHKGNITEHTPVDEFLSTPRSEPARAFVHGILFE
tara:strand:- start:348 stop:1058 length:711 start_codon:yes stop_codon:yes gene_type:complete